jgi:hypothetical protein
MNGRSCGERNTHIFYSFASAKRTFYFHKGENNATLKENYLLPENTIN